MSDLHIRDDLLSDEDFRISDTMKAGELTGIIVDVHFESKANPNCPNNAEEADPCKESGDRKIIVFVCNQCDFKVDNKSGIISHVKQHETSK